MPATIRLSRIKWQTNRLATAGDTSEFESKALLKNFGSVALPTKPGLADNRKPASATLENAVADKPGEYLLEAIGKDAGGHDVLTSTVFEVSGEGETDWNYRNPYVIDLVAGQGQLRSRPDRDAARENADRRRRARHGGTRPLDAFLHRSADRQRAFRAECRSTRGRRAERLRLRHAPARRERQPAQNENAGVPHRLRQTKVARPNDKLTVTVKPGSPSARPGDTVQLEAEVKDASGKPAAEAELTLYAVDEGVLSLTGYETPDPLAFFEQPRGLSVSTSLTLPTLLREDAPEADFANKGYLIGDGKGGAPQLERPAHELRRDAVLERAPSTPMRRAARGPSSKRRIA